jgi:MFS superfamily sulfate permease-like transporter
MHGSSNIKLYKARVVVLVVVVVAVVVAAVVVAVVLAAAAALVLVVVVMCITQRLNKHVQNCRQKIGTYVALYRIKLIY